MRSMTGYGQATGENARHGVTVALRSVNHRSLDLQVRLPEEARGSEPALRELVGREASRGRVEARVDVAWVTAPAATVRVNLEVVRAAHAATHELAAQGLLAGDLTAGDLLRLPEAFRVEVAADAWDAEDEALLLRVAAEALAQLVAGREREGASLAAVLAGRLDELVAVAARLAALSGTAKEEIAAALRRRLAELLADHLVDKAIDEARLAQEVALLVDKSDVAEEMDRLGAHLAHFRELLADPGAVGKRLDFLTQEIFRELNTTGAKCRNAEMTRLVLDAKVLCEQLREQVQNVE